MTLGVIISLFGLGALLALLFTLAVHVVPFFVGLTVGMWAFETGAGVIGALLVGLVAGVVALLAAQVLFASVRSPIVRGIIALLFAAPAALTGYHAVLGISALLVPSEAWRHVFAATGGLIVGATAAVQLARSGVTSRDRGRVTLGRSDETFAEESRPDQPRLPSTSVPRRPAPSAGSRA
jgi:hypothetical protein